MHQYHTPESWGAKLEGGPYWTLAANEGSTPGEAIANLQQAIAAVFTKTTGVNSWVRITDGSGREFDMDGNVIGQVEHEQISRPLI